jgi:hypothetical protein
MTIEKTQYGYLIYESFNGYLESMHYVGYSKKQAISKWNSDRKIYSKYEGKL